jgi:hypothetical protein
MVTRVLSWVDLRQTWSVGPLAQDRHPTKMAEGLSQPFVAMATYDLHHDHHYRRPV